MPGILNRLDGIGGTALRRARDWEAFVAYARATPPPTRSRPASSPFSAAMVALHSG